MPGRLDLRPYGINWILDSADPTSVYRDGVPLLSVNVNGGSLEITLPAAVAYENSNSGGSEGSEGSGGNSNSGRSGSNGRGRKGRGWRTKPGAATGNSSSSSITPITETSKKYKMAATLGRGSYGTTKPITDVATGDTTKCVKILSKNQTNRKDFIIETIKQIIIVNASERTVFPEINLKGPFAPRVFYVGEDATYYYIIMEKMGGTFMEYMTDMKLPQNEGVLYSLIAQTAKISDFLYRAFEYNHRDLKTNNIMYIEDATGVHVRFIDFGLSCLKYHGLEIGITKKDLLKHCSSEVRDMSFLIFFIFFSGFEPIPSETMKNIARALLDTRVYNPNTWRDSYSLYNSPTYVNPNMAPHVVYKIFRDPAHWYRHLVVLNYTTVSTFYNDPLFDRIDTQLILDYICSPLLKREHTPGCFRTLLDRIITAGASAAEALQCLISRLGNDTHLMELAMSTRLDCVALFALLKDLPSLKIADTVYVIYAIKFNRPDDLEFILKRSRNLSFLSQPYEGKTPLQWACAHISDGGRTNSRDATMFYMLLATSAINLKVLDGEYFNLIYTIIDLIGGDLRLELLDTVLKKDSSSDFINNRAAIPRGIATPLQYAFTKGRIESIHRLLDCPDIDLNFRPNINGNALTATVQMKPDDTGNSLFDKVLSIASQPGRVRGASAIDITQALSESMRLKYIPWITKLLDSPLELPREILHNIYTDDPEVIDLVLGKTSTPAYVNRLNSEGRTPLITAIVLKNYYFAKKLLGLPFIKTAVQDRMGKTALHYAAVESAIYEKSHANDGGEAFEIVKLLVARNPVLAGLRNQAKRGPSNPAYVGANSATRKFIKARKYRFMTPRNSNRNIKE